jgi:hypothetical protein
VNKDDPLATSPARPTIPSPFLPGRSVLLLWRHSEGSNVTPYRRLPGRGDRVHNRTMPRRAQRAVSSLAICETRPVSDAGPALVLARACKVVPLRGCVCPTAVVLHQSVRPARMASLAAAQQSQSASEGYLASAIKGRFGASSAPRSWEASAGRDCGERLWSSCSEDREER